MTALAHAPTPPAPGTGAGEVLAGAEARKPWMAWLLLGPGILWLIFFFVFPLIQLATVSLQSRNPGFPGYYYRDFNVHNYVQALTDYGPHFARSFGYAAIATLLAFALAYPLAYALAFKAGRWRSVMLICIIAPFFTSFILRTFAWQQILADDSWVTE